MAGCSLGCQWLHLRVRAAIYAGCTRQSQRRCSVSMLGTWPWLSTLAVTAPQPAGWPATIAAPPQNVSFTEAAATSRLLLFLSEMQNGRRRRPLQNPSCRPAEEEGKMPFALCFMSPTRYQVDIKLICMYQEPNILHAGVLSTK